jgi:hypothetical protein
LSINGFLESLDLIMRHNCLRFLLTPIFIFSLFYFILTTRWVWAGYFTISINQFLRFCPLIVGSYILKHPIGDRVFMYCSPRGYKMVKSRFFLDPRCTLVIHRLKQKRKAFCFALSFTVKIFQSLASLFDFRVIYSSLKRRKLVKWADRTINLLRGTDFWL